MTYDEAYEILFNVPSWDTPKKKQARQMLVEAIDKQCPKTPNKMDGELYCPICGKEYDGQDYCPNCGQRMEHNE